MIYVTSAYSLFSRTFHMDLPNIGALGNSGEQIKCFEYMHSHTHLLSMGALKRVPLGILFNQSSQGEFLSNLYTDMET